jgi:molecular chaperone DnaJ
MAKRDYYEILGLDKSAGADEIKRAYRKLAMQHHPDKHGGDDTQFKEINEAYETLKDGNKRAQYDQFGHSGPFGAGNGGQGFGGFDFNGANFDFSQFGGFGDIFDMFTGGATGTRARQQARRGADIEVGVRLEFKEAVFGTETTLHFNAEDRCDRCEGKGNEPGTKIETCDTCKGAGQVTRVQQTILGAIRQTTVCPTCEGLGEIPEHKCTKCRGKGTVKVARELKVKIPAGVDDGITIRLAGKGGQDRKGPAGDLYLRIRVKPDPRLHRKGQDIESTINVPMTVAALGGEGEVETVDGPVKLKVPAGTQSGKVFKLSERGVPGLGGRKRGDHLVTVAVEIPAKLSAKQKQLLEQFEAESGKKRGFFN